MQLQRTCNMKIACILHNSNMLTTCVHDMNMLTTCMYMMTWTCMKHAYYMHMWLSNNYSHLPLCFLRARCRMIVSLEPPSLSHFSLFLHQFSIAIIIVVGGFKFKHNTVSPWTVYFPNCQLLDSTVATIDWGGEKLLHRLQCTYKVSITQNVHIPSCTGVIGLSDPPTCNLMCGHSDVRVWVRISHCIAVFNIVIFALQK